MNQQEINNAVLLYVTGPLPSHGHRRQRGSPLLPSQAHLPIHLELSNKPVGLGFHLHGTSRALPKQQPRVKCPDPGAWLQGLQTEKGQLHSGSAGQRTPWGQARRAGGVGTLPLALWLLSPKLSAKFHFLCLLSRTISEFLGHSWRGYVRQTSGLQSRPALFSQSLIH